MPFLNMSVSSIFFRVFLLTIMAVAALLSLLPWYSDYLSNVALRQAGKGFQVESLHAAEKAVAANPFSINSLFVLAGAQQRMGRQAEARESLIRATELQPQNYATWRQLAVYELDYWQMTEEAKANFARAIDLNPHDAGLKNEAGYSSE